MNKNEFLTEDEAPELQELRARMASDIPMKIGVGVISVMLVGFIAWASLVPLTEGVVATGSVVVDTAHKVIQHLEGGIVKKLHVREDDEVKKGDILIELDETQARTDLSFLESRYYTRLAEIDRLNAERLSHQKIVFSEGFLARHDESHIADMLAVQQDLFAKRNLQYHGQIEILGHRINQFGEKIIGLEAGRQAARREQVLIKRNLNNLENLYQQNLIDESSLITRQREYEQNTGHISSIVAEIAGTKVAISETRQEIIQFKHTFHTEIANQITKVQQELFEVRERLSMVRDVLRRTRITAPQDGKVIGLTAHTVGGVILSGKAIMNIVPSQEQLMVEGQIRPTDVDNVYPGQQARLRFSAFSQRDTPEIIGHVERVSADAFQRDEAQESFYVARILVTEEELARLGDVQVGPGMPVEIMFTGGDSTAMAYLIAPLNNVLKKAMIEE